MVLWKTTKVDSVDICNANENALRNNCTEPILISMNKIIETLSPNDIETKEKYDQTLNVSTNEIKKINKIKEDSGITDKQEVDECTNEISNFTAKDCGYAWIVLGAMFIINMLTVGYFKSLGVIYNAIADMHLDASTTMAGIMMGLLTGFMSLLAPFAGAIGNLIGIRLAMFIGTFLYCFSFMAAFFCTSPIHYVIVLGAITGLGLSFYEPCQVVVMSYYFENRLSLANGIRVAGNPFGNAVYPLLLAVLLEYFGLKLTLILLAGVTAQIFVCAALVRPWNMHLKIKGIKFVKDNLDKRFVAEVSNKSENREKKFMQKKLLDEIMTKYSGPSGKKRKTLEFSFLKNPVYLLFVSMASGIALSCPLLYYYVTIYAKTVLHLSVYEVSTLLSVQSVLDMFMRFAIGALSNKKWYKMTHGYIFCLTLSGIGCLCVPIATEFWSLLCFTFIFSFGANSYHVFANIILSDQFGKESIASTFGFVRMTQGIFAFIHPVLLGYIIDATGGYSLAFITMGLGMFFSAFTILIEPCVIKLAKSDIVIT